SGRGRAMKVERTRKHSRFALTPAELKVMRLRECAIENPVTDTPERINSYWREHIPGALWFDADNECFCVFLLNTRRRLIGFNLVSAGTLDTCLFHPREVFRVAIHAGASAIVLTHNHPSGDPTPSDSDLKVTD